MEVAPAPTTTTTAAVAKRLWRMVRVLYYTLRKGVAKRRQLLAAAGLHLLLKRGKVAGRATMAILTAPFHHHHSSSSASSPSSARHSATDAVDLTSFCGAPSEVEFSCSTTPSYTPFRPAAATKRQRRRQEEEEAAEAVRVAFELLSSGAHLLGLEEEEDGSSVLPSPSPLIWSSVRQLRVTDSPFPVREEDEADSRVDEQAEEFIQKFYRQLRQQQTSSSYA